ncbi:MAG: patatin-like phospholipase family protein [Patescibacteria group bacterium]
MKSKKHPTIGVALGSGGAKGLAHIGVLKTLEKHGIEIDYVAGSSIGALIGSYYAAYPNLTGLEKLVFDFNRKQGFSLFDPAIRGGLLKGNRLEEFISDMLEGATFEKLRIPFIAVATDFNTAEEVLIRDGSLVKAVRASIAIPAIFQPIWYKDRLLADGGLSDPIPVRAVKAVGSDIVIAVNLDSATFRNQETKKLPVFSTIPMHAITILRHHLALQTIQAADIIITPKTAPVSLIGWNYFFDNEKAKSMIEAGEKAAEKIIPDLLKLIEQKREEKQNVLQRIVSFFR